MHDILKKDVSGSAGFILILSKQIWKEKTKPVNLESDNVLGVQRKVSSRWWGKVKSSQAVGEDGVLCSREEELFQLISHDRGVGLYVPPPLLHVIWWRENLLLLSHKSQEELKVEKWASVSWDVNEERQTHERDDVRVRDGWSRV